MLLRHLEPLVQPYSELAKAFARAVYPAASGAAVASSSSGLSSPSTSSQSAAAASAGRAEHGEVALLQAQHAELFAHDRNAGLVKQLSARLLQLQIQRLTATYLTLPLTSLSALVHSPAASVEAWLTELIARGVITARIDGRLGLVSFLEADAAGDDVAAVRRLDRQIRALLHLRESVQRSNARIAAHPVYVARAVLSEKDDAAQQAQQAQQSDRTGLRAGHARAPLQPQLGHAALASEDEQLKLALAHSMAYQ